MVWFGTVSAFFTLQGPPGKLEEIAYVLTPTGEKMGLAVYIEWYEQTPNSERTKHLNLLRLKRSKDERVNPDGSTEMVDWTDIMAAKEIIRPVLLQADPTFRQDKKWFYNPYVV